MRWLAALLLSACLLAGSSAQADPVPADVQARFLRDRDITQLLVALERPGAQPPEAIRRLARIAAVKAIPPASPAPGPDGLDGLPYLVQALRAGDLEDAGRRVGRVDRKGGLVGAWAHALVRLRRGDDAGAIGRLLAPPFMDWYRDAFPLALLGAALRDDDRRMLAAGARAALERAAARRRTPAIVAMARALAALDPEAGRRAHAFAIDALRRGGEPRSAVGLLAAAPSAGVAPTDPLLALQAALLAWEQGKPDGIPRLLAGRPPPGTQSVYLALRRAGRRPRAVVTGAPLGHLTGARAHAEIGARLATALGVEVSAAEIERWCRERKLEPDHAGTLRAFLENRGLVVLSIAGDARAGDALLAAGLPFVLLRIAKGEQGYRDMPALVKAYDSATGLWILDEPNVRLFDVIPHAESAKARFLCAVPKERRSLLAPFESAAVSRTGRLLERALDAADRGTPEAGLTLLGAGSVPSGGVADLYRGLLLYRAAVGRRDSALWERTGQAVQRSRRTAPMLAFEELARGEALGAANKPDEALGAFDHVAYLEGESGALALARFAVERARGNRTGARTDLDAALRLAPLDVRALYHRAAILVELGSPVEARADLRRALERRPDAVRFAVKLSNLELTLGRPAEALALLGDIVRRNRALAEDPVLKLARRQAENALIESAEAVGDLRSMARSEDATTRRRLAFELARRSSEADAAEPLLRILLADKDPEMRVTTLRLYMRPWLRERVEADAVLARGITTLLEEDPDPAVRRAAADLLGRVHSPLSCRVLTAAVGGARRDADAGVRGAAARALRSHALEGCRAVLVAALEDEDLLVRKAAALTLFELTGTTRGFEAGDPPEKRAAAVKAWRAWLKES